MSASPSLTRDLDRLSVRTRPAGAPLSILAVDDSSTNRLIMSRMLQALGHQVETAESGEQAVEAAASRPFDLILMDVQMPGIGGVEAARRIRASTTACAAAPIVPVTADASSADEDAYRSAGMAGVLAKPFSASALHAVVERTMAEAD